MDDTGRISQPLTYTARRILFEDGIDAAIDLELPWITEVDRAHIVMLVERNLLDRVRACHLLDTIDELRSCRFAPLRGLRAPRGLYLVYEEYLCQKLGMDVGGMIHLARSRNDLNATTLKLRLRRPFICLISEALRIQAILLLRAHRFANIVMPAYTHYRAALPITYGHYLAGVAWALDRDIAALFTAAADLDCSPLGAGAIAGTRLPIDPVRTAVLLGFSHPPRHSIDAVASRDFVLRLLANIAILGNTLSRLASDILLWSTDEFGFLVLPDSLVGSSSMMPQKRNPFLLEHIQGRSAVALGAFVSAATAMHAAPFSNSVAVNTEATAPVWTAFDRTTEAIVFARLVVSGARPQPSAMAQRAVVGYTAATELANRLVMEGGMSFRAAHHLTGALVRDAIERGTEPLAAVVARASQEGRLSIGTSGLDPDHIAHEAEFGGGPGSSSLRGSLAQLRRRWEQANQRRRLMERRWRIAQSLLDSATHDIRSDAHVKPPPNT